MPWRKLAHLLETGAVLDWKLSYSQSVCMNIIIIIIFV